MSSVNVGDTIPGIVAIVLDMENTKPVYAGLMSKTLAFRPGDVKPTKPTALQQQQYWTTKVNIVNLSTQKSETYPRFQPRQQSEPFAALQTDIIHANLLRTSDIMTIASGILVVKPIPMSSIDGTMDARTCTHKKAMRLGKHSFFACFSSVGSNSHWRV